MLLVASTKTREDLVYQAAKALHQGRDKLIAVTPVFRDFEPARIYTQFDGIDYHPGAVRYFKEAGLTLVTN
jgi:TRAP-type uncharacterized transport system substrate-binding protein